MNDIKKLIDLAIETSPTELAYNRFCSELEKAIRIVFAEKNYVKNSKLSEEQYILRNVVQSFANKLYVQKVYVDDVLIFPIAYDVSTELTCL